NAVGTYTTTLSRLLGRRASWCDDHGSRISSSGPHNSGVIDPGVTPSEHKLHAEPAREAWIKQVRQVEARIVSLRAIRAGENQSIVIVALRQIDLAQVHLCGSPLFPVQIREAAPRSLLVE